MIYSNGRPSTTESRRACPCCAACEGVNCNGGDTEAAAPISALTMVPRCGLIECSISAFAGLGDRLWLLLQAQFDALSASAAMHAIRDVLEATALPSAMCESVY